MSDAEHHGLNHPGPCTYNADDAITRKAFTSSVSLGKKPNALGKSWWRFEKTNKPDVGSYKNAEQEFNKSTIRKSPSVKMSKKVNERFTTLIAKSKMYIPGTGNYNCEETFKKLSRPPSATRRRR